ncbi:Vegetative incompatibility protein HET-E-1 [Cytospora mali]|uniref:Vegetative incompatibility protein HET-E-1 n=1 Tax=Cytospora mali TaxID=578113 RepID=A0A194VLE6_CYTMA|nr:Vegetative incompatibility protein HET-E-1 [Valsa mali]
MWLINTSTLQLEQVVDETRCLFVILSHTWMSEGEVTFQDMQDVQNVASKKPGFKKITHTCNIARRAYNKYVWIDTCCIDKTSSAELSEAINSMFRWYRNAEVCYVFLSDFEPLPILPEKQRLLMVADRLHRCKWFTRGWTLQELIAPKTVEFFDREWNFIGVKSDLVKPLHDITNIDESVLKDSSRLHTIPVARRMSWAAGRETTRVEDMAYCLLGIFDINMPLLYGEGSKSFLRLQKQIASENADLSLFAWQCAEQREYSGLFADSPSDFAQCAQLKASQDPSVSNEIAITNIGVRLNVSLYKQGMDVVLSLNCMMQQETSPKWIAIFLKKVEQTYVRWMPFEVALSPHKRLWRDQWPASPIYVQPRLLPDDIRRMSAMHKNAIIIKYDKRLAELVGSRRGYPAAAYFETPLSVGREVDNHDPSTEMYWVDQVPADFRGMWSTEPLAKQIRGAVFRTQEAEQFVGVHIINLKLGPEEPNQPLVLVVCLQWNGDRLSFNHGLYSVATDGVTYAMMQRIQSGLTEQECLEEVQNYLLAHCSDLSVQEASISVNGIWVDREVMREAEGTLEQSALTEGVQEQVPEAEASPREELYNYEPPIIRVISFPDGEMEPQVAKTRQ